ncbi:unnamed protein product [Trichobilharzia regenti]|nr:unnamed protein product [Trichobilharzia regenti]
MASIFDPVGIIAPILLPAKLILQDTRRRRLEWDADLPEDCLATWKRWYKNINYLHKIRILRCIIPVSCELLSIQLHCFSYASEFACGDVAYIHADVPHQVHCSLLLAKFRVAPLKSVTVPRLELVAVELCLEIAKHLQQQLRVPISSTTYWTN